MNSVALIGRLGKAPESRSTGSGKKVANFSIAVDHGYGDKKTTHWIDVVAWEKTAEAAVNYLEKGSRVAVKGRLQQRSWQDRDGNTRNKLEVVAEELTFLSDISSRKPQNSEFDQPQTEEPPF